MTRPTMQLSIRPVVAKRPARSGARRSRKAGCVLSEVCEGKAVDSEQLFIIYGG